MIQSSPAPRARWAERIGDVVDDWLFPATGRLPETLVIPLENPHLHRPGPWRAVLGDAVSDFGVVAVHDGPFGNRFGVAKPVLGAAATAMLADAAIRRGARRLVGVGFCGGTQPTLRCGDHVIATSARADDGVATRYLPPGASASPAVPAPWTGRGPAESWGTRGAVHSVAAVHLEDDTLVENCRADGVLGIDMETATLYAVATARSAEALALLTVSDVPATGAAADGPTLARGEQAALEQVRHLVNADQNVDHER